MNGMDGIDWAKVRASCDAATPGPWYASKNQGGRKLIVDMPSDTVRFAVIHSDDTGYDPSADAEFIVTARTALPAALVRAEAAEAEVERLRALSPAILEGYAANQRLKDEARAERDALQARLAAVLALCDEWDALPNDTPQHVDGKLRAMRVRAAAVPVPDEQRAHR